MDDLVPFEFKDAFVAALRAAAAEPGSVLAGVQIEDAWPSRGIRERDSVLVLDIDGDQQPATLRAGGGTRDDTFRQEVAVAAVRKTGDAAAVRARAGELRAAVAAVARGAGGQAGFGVAGVRRVLPRNGYRIREFFHDKGRECDVHFELEVLARLRP